MKTVIIIRPGLRDSEVKRTKAWSKDRNIEVGGKLLHLCREHALAGYDVAGQADTNHFQNSLKDEHGEMR